MAQFKYIRGQIGFAIFDMGQSHDDIARHMSSRPESAGFCTLAVGYRPNEHAPETAGVEEEFVSVYCYGESHTLKLKSREEDGAYLERQISSY